MDDKEGRAVSNLLFLYQGWRSESLITLQFEFGRLIDSHAS